MSALEKKPSPGGSRVLPAALLVVHLVLLAWIVLGSSKFPASAGPCWKAAGGAAGASLALEAAQYVLAVGSSDVPDVVVNTAGALAGTGLSALARRRLQARTAPVMTWACSIGTVLALPASGLFAASELRYAPPRAPRSPPRTPCPCRTPGHRRGRTPTAE